MTPQKPLVFNQALEDWTQFAPLREWVLQIARLTNPEKIHLCDGSEHEYHALLQEQIASHQMLRLNDEKKPSSFYCRTHPDDVARVEKSTFICTKNQEDAGPTNHWKDPKEMKKLLEERFSGSMQGRVMYVIPFCMGPLRSSFSQVGVQISDSAYVVCNMRIMARMGKNALRELEKRKEFIPCVHSVGVPLKKFTADSTWPCNPKKVVIAHFPEEKAIFSFGSGYGGNALLGKKCLALRIASYLAKKQNWLAEHMLIVGVTNPEGEKKYFAAAFPSACGKTNLAMLSSALDGWKVECVGDDIAWMRIGEDGRLWAVNPEAGMFGVAPGTSKKTNPHAVETISKNTIFTNVALTFDHDVWWEGLTEKPPEQLFTWRGDRYDGKGKASHPNARFTAPLKQCPVVDPCFEDPQGVPIEAIIFGGRREDTLPLVCESFSWNHGVFMGATLSSQRTAAAEGAVGEIRHDPFAMLPFCGYHMGQYFAHWISMGRALVHPPKIFQVNWFMKDKGKFLWPGFGENIRVLDWIFHRVEDRVAVHKTPIGYLPKTMNLKGLDLEEKDLVKLFAVDQKKWKQEVERNRNYFKQFSPHFPQELTQELEDLEKRLF